MSPGRLRTRLMVRGGGRQLVKLREACMQVATSGPSAASACLPAPGEWRHGKLWSGRGPSLGAIGRRQAPAAQGALPPQLPVPCGQGRFESWILVLLPRLLTVHLVRRKSREDCPLLAPTVLQPAMQPLSFCLPASPAQLPTHLEARSLVSGMTTARTGTCSAVSTGRSVPPSLLNKSSMPIPCVLLASAEQSITNPATQLH